VAIEPRRIQLQLHLQRKRVRNFSADSVFGERFAYAYTFEAVIDFLGSGWVGELVVSTSTKATLSESNLTRLLQLGIYKSINHYYTLQNMDTILLPVLLCIEEYPSPWEVALEIRNEESVGA
jgi:hypothetical protein